MRRLLEDGQFEPVSVLVTPTALGALSDLLTDSRPWPVYVCSQPIVRAVTGFAFHRGCLALARRAEATASCGQVAGGSRVIALEGVGNPDNIGGLFRVAAAMAADGVILDRTCADPLYRKAIRTSMGSTLRVPFLRVHDWMAGLKELRARGLRLVALSPDPSAASIHLFKPVAGERLVLMLGAEGSGLTPSTMALADARVRIPMHPRADSLNVVVAAGIALFALRTD